MINITGLAKDPDLFGPWFKDPESWQAWFAFLRAISGQRMTPRQRAIYTKHTQRRLPPKEPVKEAWMVVGRRGGKSIITSFIATTLAITKDWTPYLSPGERAKIMVIAQDRNAARVIFGYISAMFTDIPRLKELLEGQPTVSAIHLTNRITIEIQTGSFRAVRGYTIGAALLDEIAFWRDEKSANPDAEILKALRPGMKTIPDSMLIALSSPYSRRGVLWETYEEYFGLNDPRVLVWQAATREMNPTIPAKEIEQEYEKDPASAAAEYGAEFRKDVETLFNLEGLKDATVSGVQKVEPNIHCTYVAFTDPSGGAQDSFTLAIAHLDRQRKKVVLDCIAEQKPPFSPDAIVEKFTGIMEYYRVGTVIGDRYGGDWPRERFRAHGVAYEISDKTRSELYLAMLSAINSHQIELLDSNKLRVQLLSLDRRTSMAGRDTVDHPPGAHDDVANAVAGALVNVLPRTESWKSEHLYVGDEIHYGGYVAQQEEGLPRNWQDELTFDY